LLDFLYDPPERNPGKPWIWILIDSLIISGITFISTLPSDRLPTTVDLYISLKAFLYAFLIQVAVERGLKPYLAKRNNNNEGDERSRGED
jgi:hypothetical protein